MSSQRCLTMVGGQGVLPLKWADFDRCDMKCRLRRDCLPREIERTQPSLNGQPAHEESH